MAASFRIKKSSTTSANALKNTTNFPVEPGSIYFTKDHFVAYDYTDTADNNTNKRALINAAYADTAGVANDLAPEVFSTYFTTTSVISQITSWNAGTVPSVVNTSASVISSWSAGVLPSFESVAASRITSYSPQSHSYVDGTMTVNESSLSYTEITASHVVSAGELPTLTYDTIDVSEVTSVGTPPQLSYITGTALKYADGSGGTPGPTPTPSSSLIFDDFSIGTGGST